MPVEEAGPAARGHGVDVQLRRLDGDASGRRLVDVFVRASEAGDIGGGAALEARERERERERRAREGEEKEGVFRRFLSPSRPPRKKDRKRNSYHVKPDDLGRHDRRPAVRATPLRGAGVADVPARRTRQDGPVPGEGGHGRQGAVRLHEGEAAGASTLPCLRRHQAAVKAGAEGGNVAGDLWGQVGVRGGGVAAGHHLDDGRDVGGQRDLGEADAPRDGRDRPLVVREQGGVLEDDGQGPEAGRVQGFQVGLDHAQVGRPLHPDGLARHGGRVGAGRLVGRGVVSRVGPRPPARQAPQRQHHALVHLHHRLVQDARAPDGQVKDGGPGLVADVEQIPKPGRDGQRAPLAVPLQQRVGRDGGAHPDGRDAGRVQRGGPRMGDPRLLLQDAADAFSRRVRVVGRVDGQQLGDADGDGRGWVGWIVRGACVDATGKE